MPDSDASGVAVCFPVLFQTATLAATQPVHLPNSRQTTKLCAVDKC